MQQPTDTHRPPAVRWKWVGPFRVRDYLDNAISQSARWAKRWPPDGDAVYLVSQRKWAGQPTPGCGPLYVGGNTGRGERFCTRVGDLIADLHGFYGKTTGHHSGGQKLWVWCNEQRRRPGDLFLAWASGGARWCAQCVEARLIEDFWDVKDFQNQRSRTRCPEGHA